MLYPTATATKSFDLADKQQKKNFRPEDFVDRILVTVVT